ncbi:SDR family oxidoreductase [Mangrovibacterium marinum]|uniref:NAD(P)-dependent dehydrogenase (Short-subunit alcohol dehydrogenase family) n=1 Tax=Mangrovibacterium marinum TaxID=1639118 RepID=A0A2T5BZ08_9BACT|nr:SDR family oxidoreductase [Mangrovibacterium marinum]PTN07496.1 NAD(P)-dependent dehydrogenase (short-subunit alcohol dehydrogenase family) [Mangrovibacterium marinum]
MEPISFNDLAGKVCVVTGGYGVLGIEMVKALASVKARIAILGRNKEAGEKAAAEISSTYKTTVIGVQADVLDKDSLEKAKAVINEQLGDVAILINGAGGNSPSATTKVEELTESNIDKLEDSFFGLKMDGFDHVFDLNFKGTLLPTMVFAKDMIKNRKGAILNITSMNSYKPLTKIPAYSAAKAAVNNFTEWLAVHFAKTGIRVNAIAPGFFITDQNRFLVLDEKTGNYSPRGQKIVTGTPMGKFGEPDDMHGATLFLLSDLAKFITGIVIPVDGGFNAYSGV